MPHFYATNLGGGGGGGGGSVTSVGLATDSTTSSILAYTNSPITSSGNIVISLSTQAANIVLAGPTSGGAAAPTFRSLVAADIPSLSGTYLTKANNLSDVSTKATAFDNISPMTTLGDLIYGGTSGTNTRLAGSITTAKKFLTQTGNGSVSAAPGWNAIVAGDISTLAVTWTGAAQFNNGLTMHSSNIGFDFLGKNNITFQDGICSLSCNSAGVISFYENVGSAATDFVDFYSQSINGGNSQIALRGTGTPSFGPVSDNKWINGGAAGAWKQLFTYTVQPSSSTTFVSIGNGGLATTATGGMPAMSSCAGAPTGTLSPPSNYIPWVYDRTDDKMYVYNSGWKSATFA